jgi:hypothetical protein
LLGLVQKNLNAIALFPPRHSRAGLESSIPRLFWILSLRGNDGYFDRLVLKKARVHESMVKYKVALNRKLILQSDVSRFQSFFSYHDGLTATWYETAFEKGLGPPGCAERSPAMFRAGVTMAGPRCTCPARQAAMGKYGKPAGAPQLSVAAGRDDVLGRKFIQHSIYLSANHPDHAKSLCHEFFQLLTECPEFIDSRLTGSNIGDMIISFAFAVSGKSIQDRWNVDFVHQHCQVMNLPRFERKRLTTEFDGGMLAEQPCLKKRAAAHNRIRASVENPVVEVDIPVIGFWYSNGTEMRCRPVAGNCFRDCIRARPFFLIFFNNRMPFPPTDKSSLDGVAGNRYARLPPHNR